MTAFRKAAAAAAVASVCAALAACGPHGPKGDRGLPPPPENLAYPNINRTPPDGGRPLKSQAEQKRLEADLLARKPQR